jgi:hypothetical protein
MTLATYSIEVTDSEERTKRYLVPVNFDDPPTLGEIQQTADDIYDILDDVIDGKITATDITLKLTVGAQYTAKTVPANIEVGVGANFSWLQSNNRRYTMYIPTFKNSKMTGGQVVQADTAVATFITEMLTGIGGDTGSQMVSDEGLNIAVLSDAYKASRKR